MYGKILFFLLCLVLQSPAQNDSVLIFLSDTQAPMWFEKLYSHYDDNEAATRRILQSIVTEKNLSGVIHAGDITSYGSIRSNWDFVLPFIDSLHRKHIPFFAAKGNHDYMFFESSAMENFTAFVPDGSENFSLHRFGTAVVIIVNSNFDHLSDIEKKEQQQWYQSMTDTLAADSSIHFGITVLHHSPFTNSARVEGNKIVREKILPIFYSSPKHVLLISGHAHRFEHFRHFGKDFAVIGGGGGLFHEKENPPVEHDLYEGNDGGKFFHYVRCRLGTDTLSIEVIRPLDSASPVYSFTIPAR